MCRFLQWLLYVCKRFFNKFIYRFIFSLIDLNIEFSRKMLCLVWRIDKGNTQTPLNKSASKIKDELIVGISWFSMAIGVWVCAQMHMYMRERDNKDYIGKGMALCIAMAFFWEREIISRTTKKLYLVPDKTISVPQITTQYWCMCVEKAEKIHSKKKREYVRLCVCTDEMWNFRYFAI